MNAQNGSLQSPGELMAAIDADARQLDAGGRQLAQAIRRLSTLEMQYHEEVEKALIRIYDHSNETGKRMPAEDVRKALAHRAVPKEIYGAFLSCRAEVDALKAWCRTVESSLSARQSMLNVLKAELRAVT